MSENTKTGLGIAEIIGDKREVVLELARKHGAFNVRVFGSVARGEARSDSDVDFVMDFVEKTSIFDGSDLWWDLQELLGREVDPISDGALERKPHWAEEIRQDAVTL
ncbi:MAG: nucleotidyltransferase family protein [Chloroflexota bacterium]|nr:nucleotidyltransferase family protein [Chloroflexota bacterium]